jgi:hypothetical protein
MKKIILLMLAATTGAITYAQCDKPYSLTASKTEYLDSNNVVQRTVEEGTTLEINKSDILITTGDGGHKMTGTIKPVSCAWKVPFKEGKTVFKSALNDGGQVMNITFTIESKDGKLMVVAQMDDDPNVRIRVAVDKFEEKG